MDKLLRDQYQAGLIKLHNNGFKSKRSKMEFKEFVAKLLKEELEVVEGPDFE